MEFSSTEFKDPAFLNKFKVVDREIGITKLVVYANSWKVGLFENVKHCSRIDPIVHLHRVKRCEIFIKQRPSMRDRAWFMGFFNAGAFITLDEDRPCLTSTDIGLFFRYQPE